MSDEVKCLMNLVLQCERKLRSLLKTLFQT